MKSLHCVVPAAVLLAAISLAPAYGARAPRAALIITADRVEFDMSALSDPKRSAFTTVHVRTEIFPMRSKLQRRDTEMRADRTEITENYGNKIVHITKKPGHSPQRTEETPEKFMSRASRAFKESGFDFIGELKKRAKTMPDIPKKVGQIANVPFGPFNMQWKKLADGVNVSGWVCELMETEFKPTDADAYTPTARAISRMWLPKDERLARTVFVLQVYSYGVSEDAPVLLDGLTMLNVHVYGKMPKGR